MRHWHIEASKSSISAEADNPNCDDMRLIRLLTLFSTVVFFCCERVHTSLMAMTVSVLKWMSRFRAVCYAA